MSDSLWTISALIVILILASAFFSSAETALTAASDARMRQLATKGNKNAKIVETLRADREGLIGAILIGNNAVNVLASAIATSLFITLYGEAGLLWATITMTVLLVVFAEVMPKTYALTYADRYALTIAPVIRIVVLVLSPLSLAIRWLASITIRARSDDDTDREEELRGLIELHGADGDEDDRETQAMLSSILDLNELTVEQIMTHRGSVNMINADDDLDDILRRVLESPHTRHPVFSGTSDNITGVLHVKDLLRSIGHIGEKTNGNGNGNGNKFVQDIASPAYFIPETTLLFDQLQSFRSRREHFAVVVDEYGDFRGIVTLEDILEEIVGDIDDEHDIDLPGLTAQADGSWLVDGSVTIRDLNRALGWQLPDEDASTLAGLVLFESRTIPMPGQEFRFHNIRFRVVKRDGNRITSLRLWSH
ncbi:MAG: HlyC/CorC family transporter [Candidatus Puniceispirillum sp.]|uniref:HlyC/CorC family transporter n=1 Tax=Candidatus Puniceispirillum sp. TaxID=2026719 RepID=UPI001EC5A77B|nr:HlyC/CorC family transporter [Candidatus Puniceispirillum sp.]MBT6414683.1 HlyC/CorC family transporter [Candidatus Puniceispirillum sp.]